MSSILARVRSLNALFSATPSPPRSGTGPVLLLLDRDQRLHDNWAVVYAQDAARKLNVPLVVTFAACPACPGTTLRAWSFALRGMAEVARQCEAAGIRFVLLRGAPETVIRLAVSEHASLFVTDFSPLRHDRAWRDTVGAQLFGEGIAACEVDAHNVVPVWIASQKLEYAARTLRPRIMSQVPRFLAEFPPFEGAPPPARAHPETSSVEAPSCDAPERGWSSGLSIDWDAALAAAPVDRSVQPVAWATPGYEAGMTKLRSFLGRLVAYSDSRNDPTQAAQSGLSPWLHFGQIAPARAAMEAYRLREATPRPSPKVTAGIDAFIEELVVRRELAENYCHYNPT